MPRGVKIDWNVSAFEEIRRLPAVKAELEKHAGEIAERANGMSAANGAEESGGYLAVPGEGRTRSRAAVVTSNLAAVLDNAAHHTLLYAIGGDTVIYTRKDGTKRVASKAQAANWGRNRR